MIDVNKLTVDEIRSLDFSTLSNEELAYMKGEAIKYSSIEQSIKLLINSIYGAFGSEYFHFFNLAIAESVTLQGQDAIKFTEIIINRYFSEFFHKDKELHKALGLAPDFKVKPITQPVTSYMDTDSCYVSFEHAMNHVNWTGDVKEFILLINDFRLAGYIKAQLELYAKNTNTKSFLDFELETIAKNAIFIAKKKYVQDIIYQDGKHYNSLDYIKTKGLEIVQSSTPVFCRSKLKEIVKFMFSKEKLSVEDNLELVKLIKNLKKEFSLSNIEQISKGMGISDYGKYVANDQTELVINAKCPMHIRAAAYHNYLLNQHPELKNTYELIRSGDKVKFYYADDTFCDVFAYKSNNYPLEFAPKINHEIQFEKTILEPLNRILEPTELPTLTSSLSYTISLF